MFPFTSTAKWISYFLFWQPQVFRFWQPLLVIPNGDHLLFLGGATEAPIPRYGKKCRERFAFGRSPPISSGALET